MAAMVRQREFDPRFAYPVRVPHPRLQMPMSLHVQAAHPPPDPYLSHTPGVGEYDPKYTYLADFPNAPHVTIRKDETWRTASYPDGTKRFSEKLSYMGRAAHPPSEIVRYEVAPPKPMKPKPPPPSLGPGSEQLHERPVDAKQVWSLVYGRWTRSDAVAPFLPGPLDPPLPAFFRSSVPALPVKQVRKLIPKVWSEDGSKLSKYRKTMELCGERMSTRSSRVPTPQVEHSFNSLEESFARFHPALMLPDPSLLCRARDTAGSSKAGSIRAPSRGSLRSSLGQGSMLSRGTARARSVGTPLQTSAEA